MESVINNLKNIITMDTLIYIFIGIVLIIVLSIILVLIKQKKAAKELDELELMYNTIKSVPLAFKLNKATALSRVNNEMAQRVEECKNDFDNVQERLKECSMSLAEIDDLVYLRKVKSANKKMNVLHDKLKECQLQVNNVNDILDNVLEKENEQREQINKSKDEFRLLKKKIEENRSIYAHSSSYLDEEIASIEKMFSSFEEWMFASEFNKAADQQTQILRAMKHLETLIEELPPLYEKGKGILPRMIDEISYQYAQIKNKGVYLEHLEITKSLEIISNMLSEDLNKLRNGKLENVEHNLHEFEKRLYQLQEQIIKEDKAFDEISSNIEILFDGVKTINQEVEETELLYTRVYERFGFENWTQKFKEIKNKLANLNEMERKLKRIVLEKEVPYTTILISYKELEQSNTSFMDEISKMKVSLENACSDEERAKKQLIKLQLIVNEIRVKMSKYRLPSVSQKYDDDLYKAKVMMKDIACILKNSPLDVQHLNTQLRTSIDYIYTLYNSVNNLVGMAIMVENTIVFGNRYRSSYPEIDSELTRAELCFRNGQYTKALKIGIQAIEKMHPGAYENLINKNVTENIKHSEV